MGRRLRVFVSSTMKDLANEREAVCRGLKDFNFEPVNAEGWVPTGTGTWERIAEEIESSDVLLLVLGEGYGWVPPDAPKSDEGLSVTHLEFREARRLGLPVIPFLKKLGYDADRTSEGARNRDLFRAEVANWRSPGCIVGEFELAHDLAEKAARALVEMLTNDYLNGKIRERAPIAERTANRIALRNSRLGASNSVVIPPHLARAVARRETLLFAGAGVSMAAGLPSAAVLTEHLYRVFFGGADRAPPPSLSFAQIAGAVESLHSREALADEIKKLLSPPQGFGPTSAHEKAIQLFDIIMTTNWDNLFEQAAAAEGDSRIVIDREIDADLPARAIVKLHGSYWEPSSLVLAEHEVFRMAASRGRLSSECQRLLGKYVPIFLGTSLHDPSIVRLLEESKLPNGGYFVAPNIEAVVEARFHAWDLECIAADADAFLDALSGSVAERIRA